MSIDELKNLIEKNTQAIARLESVIHGNGKLGLFAMVHIMWRSYVWVLCTISAILGSASTWAVIQLANK